MFFAETIGNPGLEILNLPEQGSFPAIISDTKDKNRKLFILLVDQISIFLLEKPSIDFIFQIIEITLLSSRKWLKKLVTEQFKSENSQGVV